MPEHKTAIVTGARRGIGRAIALTLAREGYDVVVHDIEIDDHARETETGVRSYGRECLLVAADLEKPDAAQSLINASFDQFGQIDAVVNNAATWTWAAFAEAAEKDWDRMLAVNLKAPFLIGQSASRVMAKQPTGGSIVNISSVHRARTWPEDTIYGICKAGIVRLTESMACELGPSAIRVNAIAPGYIDSRMPDPSEPRIGKPSYAETVEPWTPLRRIGLPEDIAEVAAFLLSDRASFVTGQCLTVDGGFLLGGTPDA
jgi:NAD(P)-dependent dehydrogenase (short-subunit alcohol dehydrogenase family)